MLLFRHQDQGQQFVYFILFFFWPSLYPLGGRQREKKNITLKEEEEEQEKKDPSSFLFCFLSGGGPL